MELSRNDEHEESQEELRHHSQRHVCEHADRVVGELDSPDDAVLGQSVQRVLALLNAAALDISFLHLRNMQ